MSSVCAFDTLLNQIPPSRLSLYVKSGEKKKPMKEEGRAMDRV